MLIKLMSYCGGCNMTPDLLNNFKVQMTQVQTYKIQTTKIQDPSRLELKQNTNYQFTNNGKFLKIYT